MARGQWLLLGLIVSASCVLLRRMIRAAALFGAVMPSACASADGISDAPLPSAPIFAATSVPPSTVSNASSGGSGPPDAAEIDYARATAAGIFRRRTAERSVDLIDVEDGGYGLCLRSPARSGKGYDHALIVFARRLNGAPISQVDDDTIVYRRAADAAPCRTASIDWTRLVG